MSLANERRRSQPRENWWPCACGWIVVHRVLRSLHAVHFSHLLRRLWSLAYSINMLLVYSMTLLKRNTVVSGKYLCEILHLRISLRRDSTSIPRIAWPTCVRCSCSKCSLGSYDRWSVPSFRILNIAFFVAILLFTFFFFCKIPGITVDWNKLLPLPKMIRLESGRCDIKPQWTKERTVVGNCVRNVQRLL